MIATGLSRIAITASIIDSNHEIQLQTILEELQEGRFVHIFTLVEGESARDEEKGGVIYPWAFSPVKDTVFPDDCNKSVVVVWNSPCNL